MCRHFGCFSRPNIFIRGVAMRKVSTLVSSTSTLLRGVHATSSVNVRDPRFVPTEAPRWTRRDWAVIAVACLLSILLLWINADSCVFPEDAGTLGQEAERV